MPRRRWVPTMLISATLASSAGAQLVGPVAVGHVARSVTSHTVPADSAVRRPWNQDDFWRWTMRGAVTGYIAGGVIGLVTARQVHADRSWLIVITGLDAAGGAVLGGAVGAIAYAGTR